MPDGKGYMPPFGGAGPEWGDWWNRVSQAFGRPPSFQDIGGYNRWLETQYPFKLWAGGRGVEGEAMGPMSLGYGVTTDPNDPDVVILPNGERSTREWWESLSVEDKMQYSGNTIAGSPLTEEDLASIARGGPQVDEMRMTPGEELDWARFRWEQQQAEQEGMTPAQQAQYKLGLESERARQREAYARLGVEPSDWIAKWRYKHERPQQESRFLKWTEGPEGEVVERKELQPLTDAHARYQKATAQFRAGPEMPSWMPQYLEAPAGAGPPQDTYGAVKRGIYGYASRTPGKGDVYGFKEAHLPVKTPSGQAFGMMSDTQKQMLATYAEDLRMKQGEGRTWLDILSQVEAMRPKTPMGAGRQRRRPARQV